MTMTDFILTRIAAFPFPVLAHPDGRAKTFANRTAAAKALADIQTDHPDVTAWLPARVRAPFYVIVGAVNVSPATAQGWTVSRARPVKPANGRPGEMQAVQTCPIHGTPLVHFCPTCRGTAGGKARSAKKTRAVRRNARKPRPHKEKLP